MLFAKLFHDTDNRVQTSIKFRNTICIQKDLSAAPLWQIKNIWIQITQRLCKDILWIENYEGYDQYIQDQEDQESNNNEDVNVS